VLEGVEFFFLSFFLSFSFSLFLSLEVLFSKKLKMEKKM